jgi:hypothetical protein
MVKVRIRGGGGLILDLHLAENSPRSVTKDAFTIQQIIFREDTF